MNTRDLRSSPRLRFAKITQVAMLWPRLFSLGVEIFCSHAPFKWTNNARRNAGVTCTVVGIRRTTNGPKYIYQNGVRQRVNNINAYLVNGPNIIVEKRLSPMTDLPNMQGGNQPREGGHLILSDHEKQKLVASCPQVSDYVRPLLGSNEFIKGIRRWCIWIDDDKLEDALKIAQLNERIERVRRHRMSGNSVERSFAHVPHRFVTIKCARESQLLIPIVSSENRKYIPIGMLDPRASVTSKAFVIFDCEPFVFGVLTSVMHMTWVKAVSGRLGTGISYSSQMCYNTFPFPPVSDVTKSGLETLGFRIVDEREAFPEKTLAELYDANKMPTGLRQAHHEMTWRLINATARNPSRPTKSGWNICSSSTRKWSKLTETGSCLMPNLVDVSYAQTGQSLSVNKMGMREMQARAFEAKSSQYLLLKAPPASGKSRALMFLGLDKLFNQGLKKVIVAVPERSIGASFDRTDLKSHGFFADWEFGPQSNLCTPGGEISKVTALTNFLNDPDETILICTHATLRFAFDAVQESAFDNVLLAIDEFHHISADSDNRLGEVLRSIMSNSSAHIIAMTGSYFRGDSVPVLLPEDEARFTKVSYNYYEQLNGYTHLKTLGIGYHFYQGRYLSAIDEVLNTDQKTILHIPNVNAGESTKDKHREVDAILDIVGTVTHQDPETGVIFVKRHKDGKSVKVADLVNDTAKDRDKIVAYLRQMSDLDDLDLIIALGMAKEGFDWPFCEHALTVGYRGSLTEIIQIIGRATRDSNNKTHAQFTNLIAQPDAADDEVKLSVNNMLKAITASLLMEQVLAPNFKFKTRRFDDEEHEEGTIKIRGFKEPTSQRVKDIVESDLNDLKAAILQDNKMLQALPGEFIDPEVINKVMIPKVIQTKYPELSDEEVEELRQHVVADAVIKNGEIKEVGSKRFVLMAGKFVNIEDLHIDLIDRVNPFQKAFEVLSKSVTAKLLKVIQETIDAGRIQMTDEEAVILYRDKIGSFMKTHGREPNINALDPLEKRQAEALVYLRNKKRQLANGNKE